MTPAWLDPRWSITSVEVARARAVVDQLDPRDAVDGSTSLHLNPGDAIIRIARPWMSGTKAAVVYGTGIPGEAARVRIISRGGQVFAQPFTVSPSGTWVIRDVLRQEIPLEPEPPVPPPPPPPPKKASLWPWVFGGIALWLFSKLPGARANPRRRRRR